MPVEITGLREFQADLRRSVAGNARETTAVLKAVGAELAKKTGESVAIQIHVRRPDDPHPGQLAGSYKAQVRGPVGKIISSAPYGGGAEWGRRGKWKGFFRYGPPGRFAWKTVDRNAEYIVRAVTEGLRQIITVHGWFRGSL